LQQPFGHEVASQTHLPVVLLHSCPVPHAAQLAPAVPQELFDSEPYATHVVPLQQPLGHEVASQTHWPVALLHSSPPLQATQAAPPEPHDELDSLERASHVEPLQHPVQEPPPQLHVPLEQVSPVPHELHVAPPVPHWLDDCPA
jgi:hypothetical protein